MMAHQLFQLPRSTAISNNLTLVSGAKVSFFLTATSTPTDTYQDAGLTTPHTNPVVADSAGRLPAIYLDPDVQYRVTFTDADDVEIYPAIDPVNDSPVTQDVVLGFLSQSIIGGLLYPRTAAEIAASVTPTNYAHPEGHALRYGMVGDDSTDNTAALERLRAVAEQGIECFIPAGTYRYSDSPNWGIAGLHLSGERGGTILKHTGTGPAFVMDSETDGIFLRSCHVTDLIIDGNANTTDGFVSRGPSYSYFRGIEVRSCSGRAFWLRAAVNNTYVNCGINRGIGGVAFSAVPDYGWYLSTDDSGNYTADCTFVGCFAENFDGGVSGIGCYVHFASGNLFLGGTFESLAQGLIISENSDHNRFDTIWFEANDDNDIIDDGNANSFANIYSGSATSGATIELNGKGANFHGGYLRHVLMDSASRGSSFHGCAFSNNVSIGLKGTGTHTTHGCYQVDGNLEWYIDIPDILGPRGSFTATLTGVSGTVTGSVEYSVHGNLVTLEFPTIIGAASSTAATLTGMPTAIRPVRQQVTAGWVVNNSADVWGAMTIATSGTITLWNGVPGTAFTNSGNKGIDVCTVSYRLTAT